MDNQTLPIPNPLDWCTPRGAAMLLGVSRRTVERMIVDGRLTGYKVHGATHRVADSLLWIPEVRQLADALTRVRRVQPDA